MTAASANRMVLRVEVVPRGQGKTSESELAKVALWQRELFRDDQDIIEAFTWQDKRGLGFNLQTYRGDELVGFAHVFARVGWLDDSPVLMGCLGGVVTAIGRHGEGIGSTTVRKADEIILETLRADLGVLLCKAGLVPFYRGLGWRRVAGAVVIEQPAGRTRWPHAAMVLRRIDEDSIPQSLDLGGHPF